MLPGRPLGAEDLPPLLGCTPEDYPGILAEAIRRVEAGVVPPYFAAWLLSHAEARHLCQLSDDFVRQLGRSRISALEDAILEAILRRSVARAAVAVCDPGARGYVPRCGIAAIADAGEFPTPAADW